MVWGLVVVVAVAVRVVVRVVVVRLVMVKEGGGIAVNILSDVQSSPNSLLVKIKIILKLTCLSSLCIRCYGN